jgi:hypothetical protein
VGGHGRFGCAPARSPEFQKKHRRACDQGGAAGFGCRGAYLMAKKRDDGRLQSHERLPAMRGGPLIGLVDGAKTHDVSHHPRQRREGHDDWRQRAGPP